MSAAVLTDRLRPQRVDNTYRGYKLALWLFRTPSSTVTWWRVPLTGSFVSRPGRNRTSSFRFFGRVGRPA